MQPLVLPVFLSRQRFFRHRPPVPPFMDAAALTVNLMPLVCQFTFALISRRRDCTISKVPQTLSRLRPFLSPSLSHRSLPHLIPTLKRHFRPLLLHLLPFPSPSFRLGVPPLAPVLQRTPLKRQSLSPRLRSTFLRQAEMANPLH